MVLRCFGFEGRHPKSETIIAKARYVNGFG